LTEAARRAAGGWADRVTSSFSAVVSSDLQRAHDTAQIIASALALGHVVAMPGLREQDQGAWTGLTKDQIKRRWPERMREHPRRPVDGESGESVLSRALEAMGQIAAARQGRRVLIVTHSGVIRILERAVGADAPPVPYLEGRWFRLLSPEHEASLAGCSVLAGELTTGRRELAAAVPAAGSSRERV
jgi:broad specificity phosphatase PhoE